MSSKSALNRLLAEQCGSVLMEPGPWAGSISYNLTYREYIKWINYFPDSYVKHCKELLSKSFADLTVEEREELTDFNYFEKMSLISNKYDLNEATADEIIEYGKFLTQQNLEKLIRRKLTPEEYETAVAKAQDIIKNSSNEELYNIWEDVHKQFDEFSMMDLLTMRIIAQRVEYLSLVETGRRCERSPFRRTFNP